MGKVRQGLGSVFVTDKSAAGYCPIKRDHGLNGAASRASVHAAETNDSSTEIADTYYQGLCRELACLLQFPMSAASQDNQAIKKKKRDSHTYGYLICGRRARASDPLEQRVDRVSHGLRETSRVSFCRSLVTGNAFQE